MKQLVAALSVALVVALFVAGQSTSKKLTVVSFKSPPVEILTIKLNGKILKPNDSFTPTSDWTSNLEVTVKNVSEQPVSCVQVLLYSDKVDAAEVMTFNTDFTFGAPKSDVPVFIQPNETVVLSHTWTYGDIFDFSSASIVVQYVYWNNDETTYWGAGRILHKGQDGNYYAEPRPSAKYTLPSNFVPKLENVKAVALPTPPMNYCNKVFVGDNNLNCTAACFFGSCYVPHNATYSDPPFGECFVGCDTRIGNLTDPCSRPECNNSYCNNEKKNHLIHKPCDLPGSDPVLVDVAGNGFSLTDYSSGVLFDYAAVGTRLKIAWTVPNSDDAFLALDRNANGVIDDGSELFGDLTTQQASWAPNGFLALAAIDSNADGMIDKDDSSFKNLLLWQDTNHNGISEPAELQKLRNSGLRVINLDYKSARRQDEYGNQFRYRAKVKDFRNAQVGRWAWDVFLATR